MNRAFIFSSFDIFASSRVHRAGARAFSTIDVRADQTTTTMNVRLRLHQPLLCIKHEQQQKNVDFLEQDDYTDSI